MSKEAAKNGKKSNHPWYDGLHKFGPNLRKWLKRVVNRNRRTNGKREIRVNEDE